MDNSLTDRSAGFADLASVVLQGAEERTTLPQSVPGQGAMPGRSVAQGLRSSPVRLTERTFSSASLGILEP